MGKWKEFTTISSLFFFPLKFSIHRSLHLQNRKTILLIPLLIRWLVESSSNWGLPRIKLISTYNESSYLRHSFRKLSFNRLFFNWSKINHYIFFFPQPFDVQDLHIIALAKQEDHSLNSAPNKMSHGVPK